MCPTFFTAQVQSSSPCRQSALWAVEQSQEGAGFLEPERQLGSVRGRASQVTGTSGLRDTVTPRSEQASGSLGKGLFPAQLEVVVLTCGPSGSWRLQACTGPVCEMFSAPPAARPPAAQGPVILLLPPSRGCAYLKAPVCSYKPLQSPVGSVLYRALEAPMMEPREDFLSGGFSGHFSDAMLKV